MIKQFDAIFDGKVLHPTEPLKLKPNTRVQLTIKATRSAPRKPPTFIQTARRLKLKGPRDWSGRVEEYLYGKTDDGRKKSLS